MKTKILTIAGASATIVGTVIGAGYATGKEIMTFFGIYGKSFYIFAVLFIVLFAYSSYLFLEAKPNLLNKKTYNFFNAIILISEFLTMSTMIACLDSILSLFFSTKLILITIVIACYFIMIKGLSGLMKFSVFTIPILITIIIIVCTKNLPSLSSNQFLEIEASTPKKIVFPFLYLGLNIFSLYPICSELSKSQTKKTKIWTALFSSLFLLITLFLICTTLLRSEDKIISSELPLLMLSVDKSSILTYLTALAVTIGILSTFLSSAFILANETKKHSKHQNFSCFVLVLASYLCSKLGFGKFVEIIYPIVGFFGFALLVCLFFAHQKSKTKSLASNINIKT